MPARKDRCKDVPVAAALLQHGLKKAPADLHSTGI